MCSPHFNEVDTVHLYYSKIRDRDPSKLYYRKQLSPAVIDFIIANNCWNASSEDFDLFFEEVELHGLEAGGIWIMK